MRYTIEKENEVKRLAAEGKSSSYICSATGISERVIWNWCPETRPHDDVIKWSVKQRFHSLLPELEARISAAVSPCVKTSITEDEWENLNKVINATLFEEAIIVFRNLLEEPPEFGKDKKLSKEPLLDYFRRFWSMDSEYVKSKGLKENYVKTNYDSVHYWSMFRKNKLYEINTGDIERFYEHLCEKDLSQSRINAIMKVGLIPLKYAYANGLILNRCHEFYLPVVEKKTYDLTSVEVSKIFNTTWEDSEAYLANLLACNFRLQIQEVRALRICDIWEDELKVNNIFSDSLHENKNKRVLPLSSFFRDAILRYVSTSPYTDFQPTDYIFFSENRDRPAHGKKWSQKLSEACAENSIKKDVSFRTWSA